MCCDADHVVGAFCCLVMVCGTSIVTAQLNLNRSWESQNNGYDGTRVTPTWDLEWKGKFMILVRAVYMCYTELSVHY